MNLALLVATIGSGAGSHLAAGRLLYGMGRDNAIPSRFFSVIDPRTHIPRNNILLVGALALIGAFSLSYQLGAELLNFGAFIGFMGVNIAAFVRYYLRAEKKTFLNLVPPLIGFVICAYIWWSLPSDRQACRRGLACRRAPLRRLENQGVPPPGRVRRAR